MSKPQSAPCELLLKLFSDARGDAHLGRLLRGDDAGRFVLLRELTSAAEEPPASDVDLARSIAHPKLLKVLGFVRTAGKSYLASEYVPGVALLELRAAVRKTGTPLRAAVAARIVRDALAASAIAHDLLRDAAGIDAASAFQPDAIWIAEFGETLLVPTASSELTAGSNGAAPADTAAGMLLELGTALSPTQVLTEGLDAHLPAALASALSASLSQAARSRNEGEAALLEALSNLPPQLLANEEQVKQELVRFVSPALQLRRSVQGFELGGNEADANDATVIARLPRAELGLDIDEPTRTFRSEAPLRETDPDGVTEVGKPAVPSVPSVIIAPEARLPSPISVAPADWAKQFLEETKISARRASSKAPPANSSRRGAVFWAALAFALLAIVVSLGLLLRP